MKKVRSGIILLLLSVLFAPTGIALASEPVCTFNPDGNITCTTGGSGWDDGGGGSGPAEPTPPPTACTPGATHDQMIYSPSDSSSGQCIIWLRVVDDCTGSVIYSAYGGVEPCPEVNAPPAPPQHPCDILSVTSDGITCEGGDGWYVVATVRFPETYLDLRPFPATLVRWPTAIRNGGQPGASGSGSQAYYGSGSIANPRVGDRAGITLTLSLNPAGPLLVNLPGMGSLILPDQGGSGTPRLIQWEVPSHPLAGGGPLAGTVAGLDELPGDLPLFVGSGRSAYRLYWNLSYLVYETIEECVSGPNAGGNYNCAGGTGHRVVTGHEWRRRSSGGEIAPTSVANLPMSIAADLNNDGVMDAYWNRNLTLRRMDDSGSVDNPTYRRSWNWGGTIYWAVREGQGQIGWPGGQ